MAKPIYQLVTSDEYKLSGPHVWPHIRALYAVDRYIHRRPELSYLLFLRRSRERREEKGMEPSASEVICRITEVRRYRKGRYQHIKIGEFVHLIDHADKEDDVKVFLCELRSVMMPLLPDEGHPMLRVQLRFIDRPLSKVSITSFDEKWL